MLEAMEKTISMAQLAKNPERIADDIEAAGTVYRIKRPGRRTMMLVDHQYFESRLATLEFMQRHPNWKQELEETRREYDAGLCIPLEQILAERGLAEAARNIEGKSTVRRASGSRRTRRR
jgi:hypothetical protein